MLKKLIKYDLIWVNKFMLIFFSISLIVCLLTRIMSYFTSSFIGNILYLILRGCSISCFASLLINCIIRIWSRFNLNTYKDESYLTHTLPVSKKMLYDSKIISSIMSIVISLIVVLICFLIAFLDKSLIDQIRNIFNNMTFIVVSIILTIILEMIYMLHCGIIGILLGHQGNNNRMVKSVFIGIGLYFIVQLILLGIIYGIGLLNGDINSLFTSSFNNNLDYAVKLLFVIVNTIYIVLITGMYFGGKYLFKKGINVD